MVLLRWRRWAAFLCLMTAFVAVGGARFNIQQRQLQPDSIARSTPARGRALIHARLLTISPPQHHQKPAGGPLFSIAGDYTTFRARVLMCRNDRRWRRASGRVLVRAPGWLPGLGVNETVEVWGWLMKPAAPVNPGEFNYRRYLATRRVFSEIDLTHTAQIKLISPHPSLFPLTGWLSAWRVHLRHEFLRSSKAHLVAGNEMVALLLGFRDPSIVHIERDFSRCGAAHLLALSGLHVALIAEVIWLLLRWPIRSPRVRALLTLVLVLVYMLATPCGPPVVRAAIGTALVLLTMLAGRPVHIANILGITAMVVLLWRPAELFDASFQLSFLVTWMLIVMGPRVYTAIFGAWLAHRADIANASQKAVDRIKLRIASFISATLTANFIGSLVSLPLVMFHYHQITPWGVVTGLLLFPIVVLAMVAGLLQLFVAVVAPGIAHFAAAISAPPAKLMAWTVHALARLPLSQIVVQAPSAGWITAFYALLLVWVVRHHLKVNRAAVAAAAAALTVGFPLAALARSRSHDINMTVLSLNSGNAVLLQAGHNWLSRRAYLIDAGTAGSPQVCSRNIRAALKAAGIANLMDIFITQVDSLHAAGVLPLKHRYPHAAIWVNTADTAGASKSRSVRQFLQQLSRTGPLHPLAAGQTLSIGTAGRLHILWPDANDIAVRKYRGNVLLLSAFGQRVLILCRTQAVRAVLRRLEAELPGRTVAGVVLIGAGNLHPAAARRLAGLHPAFVVCTGETRAAQKADARAWRGLRVRCFSTSADGAVSILLNRGGVQVHGRLAPPVAYPGR
jgi:competence protein ComEC